MAEKHPGGRPTDYKTEYAHMAQLTIEEGGFSLVKLAKLFNCNRSTIYQWMEDHEEFSDSIETGRRNYEGQKIHRSLIKRAVGFNYTETTRELRPVYENGEITDQKIIITKKVKKYFPPDVAAIKHWQINRHPEKWVDKQQVDTNLTGDLMINLTQFTKDDCKKGNTDS